MGNNSLVQNKEQATLKQALNTPTVIKSIERTLGDRTSQFTSSLISITTQAPKLADVEPFSLIQTAMIAASLDLPLNQNLGFAWLIPYGNTAQFQMGYKGYVQLAIRSGYYKTINVTEVKQGELKNFDRLSSECEFEWLLDSRESIPTIGYVAVLELTTGFRHTEYMTLDEVTAHAKKFSKSFKNGPWSSDFDAMAKKTVLKRLISNWGIMSVEMQEATTKDQAVVDSKGKVDYIDNPLSDYVSSQQEQAQLIGNQPTANVEQQTSQSPF